MSRTSLHRRAFLRTAAASFVAPPLLGAGTARAASTDYAGGVYKALKYGMIEHDGRMARRMDLIKDVGFDGVELSSPGLDSEEARKASRQTGVPVPGLVDSIHWKTRLSDPEPEVRAEGLEGLKTALRDAHFLGASTVLLVPGKVTDPQEENHDQVWERSIEQIRKALPLASKLGVRIAIENVWNGFCYEPQQMAEYIDTIHSAWVGAYFDIGNHRKYGKPEEWIEILGRRIVKLDVKDWGEEAGFCKIGEGDVDWPAVREALQDLRYRGWATAEVSGGGRERLAEISERMDTYLLGL